MSQSDERAARLWADDEDFPHSCDGSVTPWEVAQEGFLAGCTHRDFVQREIFEAGVDYGRAAQREADAAFCEGRAQKLTVDAEELRKGEHPTLADQEDGQAAEAGWLARAIRASGEED